MYDLGCMLVESRSFEISSDYRIYMGSSPLARLPPWSLILLNSYKLDGSVTALTSMHEVSSFLGLIGYYHYFVPDFSKIVNPMTRLLQKDEKFLWMPECDEAFHKL